MARATVLVNGRQSQAAPTRGATAPARNSLVDKPFLRPFLVRKTSGKGATRTAVEKVALVVVDNQYMVVAPTNTGEPAVYVGRKNADKHYTFVRFLRPDESVSFPGLAG